LFKVIGDPTLHAIAVECPENLNELQKLPGMSRKQIRRHGKALLRSVQSGLRADPKYPPRPPRPNNRYIARVETLRWWRKTTAREMGVSSDVVLPRDLLYEIASQNPRQMKDLGVILDQVPWRLERFGDDILGALDQV
jgi:ribonuclease D